MKPIQSILTYSHLHLLLVFTMMCSQMFIGYAQIKIDKKAEEAYNKGLKYFEQMSYGKAVKMFQMAAQKPFNRVTTASIYMSGLGEFYQNDSEQALRHFQHLQNTYSSSKYVNDAKYHKALLLLRNPDSQLGALFILTQLMDPSQNGSPTLRADAENAYRQFLFNEAPISFLKDYYAFVKNRPEISTFALEALCYHLYISKAHEELTRLIEQHKKTNPELSPRLKEVNVSPPPQKVSKVLRIAVVLPFLSDVSKSERIHAADWSIEMLAGMEMAFQQCQTNLGGTVQVKAFDSKNDVKKTQELIAKELDSFHPSVVIGDIYHGPTKALIDYCEKQQILLLIPISPVDELVKEKTSALLINPSTGTQTSKLAEYSSKKLNKRNFFIIAEEGKLSTRQSQVFIDALKKDSITHRMRIMTNRMMSSEKEINSVLSEVADAGADALFVASNDEVFVSKLVRLMNEKNLQLLLIGSSDWANFNTVPKSILSKFQTIFADTHHPDAESKDFKSFVSSFQTDYNKLPSHYSLLGYDIVKYLLTECEPKFQQSTILELVRKAEPFKGIVQNYYFAKSNDNQSVQLLQYRNNQLNNIKLW